MTKRLQNKVSGSRLTLPAFLAYGACVWLLAGAVAQQWWVQPACFLLSTFIMAELNNHYSLIRIFSRMTSAFFIALSCAACFLFHSMAGAIAQLCMAASLLTLFRCYQDRQSPGWTFYTFLLLGLASLVKAETLFLLPAYWILMAAMLYSFSWRTFFASLLGVLLPYAVFVTGCLVLNEGDLQPFTAHLTQLLDFQFPAGYAALPLKQVLVFVLVVALSVTGTVHFMNNSYYDKIRIRQLFYSLILLNFWATALLAVQPQHYDLLIRLMIITASPLAAHFVSLTSTRITNAAFCAIFAAILLTTVFSLWTL